MLFVLHYHLRGFQSFKSLIFRESTKRYKHVDVIKIMAFENAAPIVKLKVLDFFFFICVCCFATLA